MSNSIAHQFTQAAEQATGKKFCQYCRVFLPFKRFDRHKNRRRCDHCVDNKAKHEAARARG